MTPQEAQERARELIQEGYTLLPADDPERAMWGLVAVPSQKDEEDVFIEWPVFGEPLNPDIRTVPAEELAEFIALGPVALCDDPRQRLLGFVRYRPEEGVSEVRRIALTHLKGAEESPKQAILATRERLLAGSVQGLLEARMRDFGGDPADLAKEVSRLLPR